MPNNRCTDQFDCLKLILQNLSTYAPSHFWEKKINSSHQLFRGTKIKVYFCFLFVIKYYKRYITVSTLEHQKIFKKCSTFCVIKLICKLNFSSLCTAEYPISLGSLSSAKIISATIILTYIQYIIIILIILIALDVFLY